MSLELTSSAFMDGGFIPILYTCKGSDISPELKWTGVPAGTKSFVLIMDDPDAPHGTWDHWVLYNIPANVMELPEDVAALPKGTEVGLNSWNKNSYGGPCPPSGVHRYFFKLYALDAILMPQKNMTKSLLLKSIEGHVLASAQLVGNYGTEVYTMRNAKKEFAETE